jgi:acetyltransferase-like isoleucine patch superfamily enzyme
LTSRPLIFVGSRQKLVRLAVVADLNGIEIKGILDHHYYGNTDQICQIPIIGDERWLLDKTNSLAQEWKRDCDFFIANWNDGSQGLDGIDLGELRKQRIDLLELSGVNVINLIHPDSKIRDIDSKYANIKLGRGIFIDDDCWIDGTDNVEIGDYNVISTGCTITHDVKLGKNVMVAPEVFLYGCEVGDNTYFGMFSRINYHKYRSITSISIGTNCTIWTGAEVTKSIPDNSIYTDAKRIFKKIKHAE